MKIVAEDLDKVIRLTGAEDSSGLRMALAHVLVSMWDKGYTDGWADAKDSVAAETKKCPYTQSHTRDWCGYSECRES
jgi:hypothetical protein